MADTAVVDFPQTTESTPLPEGSNSSEQQVPSDENALAVTEPAETAVAEGAPKKKKIIRKKRRPARPQVDPATIKSETPAQTGTVFNIWYNVSFSFSFSFAIFLPSGMTSGIHVY
jgi:hypothetical protein